MTVAERTEAAARQAPATADSTRGTGSAGQGWPGVNAVSGHQEGSGLGAGLSVRGGTLKAIERAGWQGRPALAGAAGVAVGVGGRGSLP